MRRDLSVPRPRDDMSCPSMAKTPEAASFILKNVLVWPTKISHNQYLRTETSIVREKLKVRLTNLLRGVLEMLLHINKRSTACK